jgi:OmpA-OmpF porin, OOP family
MANRAQGGPGFQGGQEMTVLRRRALAVLVGLPLVVLIVPGGFAAAQDVEGSRDHPLLSRMPGYHIRGYEQVEFDRHEFTGAKSEKIAIEGKQTKVAYTLDDGGKVASPIAIFRNYQNAVTKLGGKVVTEVIEQSAFGYTTLSLTKDGQEIWVELNVGNRGHDYDLVIVEKQGMQQDVVSAENWRGDLNSSGHAAVYGILFDTDKADLKPESDKALAEIAKLLKADATLSLLVVGHTDMTGDIAYNMKLSDTRAKAVVTALIAKHGIAATRLAGHGVGPLAPVAPNDTEDNRARNRRVELVKR